MYVLMVLTITAPAYIGSYRVSGPTVAWSTIQNFSFQSRCEDGKKIINDMAHDAQLEKYGMEYVAIEARCVYVP